MSTLIVVDGPNLYNQIGRYMNSVPSTAPLPVQQRYFREWLDLDRVVEASLAGHLPPSPAALGTVIFHSAKAFGKDAYRLKESNERDAFWARQGRNPGTSTKQVFIPGVQSGGEDDGTKEKGVDSSIIVHLFETIEQWDTTVIFSDDSDFEPVVWSLRRKGKRVFGAAHSGTREAPPLALACQDFFPLPLDFLREDRALFELLQPGAGLDKIAEEGLRLHTAARAASPLPNAFQNFDVLPRMPVVVQGAEVPATTLDAAVGLAGEGIFATAVGGSQTRINARSNFSSVLAKGAERHMDLFKDAFWYPHRK